MSKRTRIYTRTGDTGSTGLVGGARVSKNNGRIEMYGTLDELSSAIGIARAQLAASATNAPRLDAWLAWTQDLLFDLGAELATPAGKQWSGMALAGDDQVAALERAIDEADDDLEPLSAFILPGGTPAGAALHFARTVCRRAERLLVTLREQEPEISEATIRVVNRLSDALFVWARWINARSGIADAQWSVNASPPEPLGEVR
ncbi:MAG TPA: cob(I)yrinic acid a,c-diamide adenosyltransferase [Candidatus Rubrimentiphilum sp.]|nr:cob(I)yrinic acid a,c-diamide adenosyltransferase [Candidatus Rubrimentiphilum sp.]